MSILKLKTLIILFKTHHSLEKNVKWSLKDIDWTVNEFTVLEALYTKGQLSTQELIDKILIPNSSMTYVLDNLVKHEMIQKTKDPQDARRQWLSLTDKGRETFIEIYQIHYNHMKTIFEVLDDSEEQQLQELLKKIGKKAEELTI